MFAPTSTTICPGRSIRPKQLDFSLGVLPVQIERTTDVDVVDVVEHLAVTGRLDAD